MKQRKRPKTSARVLDKAYSIVEKNGGVMDIRLVHDRVIAARNTYGNRNHSMQMSFGDFVQKIQKSNMMDYTDGMIINRDLREVAMKWLSYTHPRTKRSKLSKTLLAEVKRVEQERGE